MKSNYLKSKRAMDWLTAFFTCCIFFAFTTSTIAQETMAKAKGSAKEYIKLFSSVGTDKMVGNFPFIYLYEDKHGENLSNFTMYTASDGLEVSPIDKEDRISAFFIPQGYYVEFYEHKGFFGPKWTFSSGYYPDLWTANDKISSMKVFKDIQDPPNGTGIPENCALFFENGNPATATIWNRSQGFVGDNGPNQTGEYFKEYHKINSIDVQDQFRFAFIKGAYKVTVYSDENLTGQNLILTDTNRDDNKGTWIDLENYGLATAISSLKVEGGKYELFEFNLGPQIKEIPGAVDETSTISSAIFNNSNNTTSMNIELASSEEESWSISNWQETSMGISTTVTIGTEGSLGGTVGPKYEVAIETSLSTALGSEKTQGTVKTTDFATGVNVSPDSGCWGGARVKLSPTKVTFKPKLVYKEVDKDRKPIPGGKSIIREVDLTLNLAKRGEAEIHTFCPEEIYETMTKNIWKVDGSSDKKLTGTFTRDGRENLIWTNGAGQEVTLEPQWAFLKFTTSDEKSFDIFTHRGELEKLGYDGKMYHFKSIPGGGNVAGDGNSNNGGGDLTVKGGDIESALLSKTFKLTNATNDYHEGTFTKLANGNLQWQNKANVKWALKPMYASNYLDTTVGDCAYKTNAGGDKFTLIIEKGQLKGFKFMTDTFYVVN